ncbi:MAG: SCO family protein [Chitinophagaceae bacterium]|jgi:protein SCO1/2
MKNKKTVIVLVGFFIVLSAAFMTYFYSVTKVKQRPLPYYGEGEHKVRPFSFINQEGQVVTNKNTEGKVYVAEYFFATCQGICPKMNENLNKVYQQFKGNPDVLFLSHTVDPEEDSSAALKVYGLQFEADPKQWMFLTGDKKALYDQARYSYLINAEDTNTGTTIDKDFIHDNHFVLVDQNGRLRGVYDGLLPNEMGRLVGDINILLKSK